jgi:hypothetical protein
MSDPTQDDGESKRILTPAEKAELVCSLAIGFMCSAHPRAKPDLVESFVRSVLSTHGLDAVSQIASTAKVYLSFGQSETE